MICIEKIQTHYHAMGFCKERFCKLNKITDRSGKIFFFENQNRQGGERQVGRNCLRVV